MYILRNHVALIRPHKQETLLKITPYEIIEKPIVSSLSASITIVNKLSVSAKNSSDEVSKFVYRKSFEARYAFTLIRWHGIGCMCVDLRWNREKDRSKDQKVHLWQWFVITKLSVPIFTLEIKIWFSLLRNNTFFHERNTWPSFAISYYLE